MKVWVTRAEPGASETAARLRALGHQPVTAPLLAVRTLPFEAPPGIGALAFTSRNGVAAAADRPEAADWRALPVFAVGNATAEAARTAGFTQVESAGGDLADLCRLLALRRGGWEGSLLHLRAREPAGPLVAPEVAVVCVAAYQADELPLATQVEEEWDRLDAVLIHSPRAARAAARATAGQSAWKAAGVCISEAAAVPIQGLAPSVIVADRPNETALLAALGKVDVDG